MRTIKFYLLGLVLTSFLVWAAPMYSAVNLEVDPARIEVKIKPGASRTGAIRLYNPGTETLRLGAEVRDWNMGIQGNPHFTKPKEQERSCSNWISFNPRVFLLKPGQNQIVRYSIRAPKTAIPGEHRSAILFAIESADLNKGDVSVSGNVVTTVYTNVGSIERRGEVLSSSANYRDAVLTVRSRIKGTGNAHIRFEGSFKIINSSGQVVGEGVYIGNTVFPGNERLLEGVWGGKLPKGSYTIKSIFRFMPSIYTENMGEYGSARALYASSDLRVE